MKAFESLMRKKEEHSKVKYIHYEKLELQTYLKANTTLNNDEKLKLFKFRTRMMELKNNFKNNYSDLKCKLGCNEIDEQKHLFECEVLLNNCDILANNVKVEYEDIFSEEVSKQINAIRLLAQIWITRKNLL